jgi:acyl carrier protein
MRYATVEASEALIEQLKELIIRRLKIPEMKPADIATDAPLFGEGLGLDSIDALELVIGLEQEFGTSIPDAEVGRQAFQSVRTLAQYVADHSP